MKKNKELSGCAIFVIMNTFVLVVRILEEEKKTSLDYIILFVVAIIVAYIIYIKFSEDKKSD